MYPEAQIAGAASVDWASANTTASDAEANPPQWFALLTRSRHEKKVHASLTNDGITTFLPLISRVHQWSDRRQVVELPLFSCYIFVRIPFVPAARVSVLRTLGVLSFVGIQGRGIPIPDSQIEDLRTLVTHRVQLEPHPWLKVGQRVRVRGGCLDGIEGILTVRDGHRRVVISVDTIEKSLAISVKGYDLEPA